MKQSGTELLLVLPGPSGPSGSLRGCTENFRAYLIVESYLEPTAKVKLLLG